MIIALAIVSLTILSNEVDSMLTTKPDYNTGSSVPYTLR